VTGSGSTGHYPDILRRVIERARRDTLEAFGASVIALTRDGAGALQAPAHEQM
jgi:hypothetical protein